MSVTIIIPVFNGEETLKECVDSAISQNCEKEIFIINDGSTDATAQICDFYKKTHSFIKVFTLKENKGQSFARNVGISHSTKKYIFFLDADDVLVPNSLPELLKFSSDLIVGDFSFIYYDQAKQKKSLSTPKDILFFQDQISDLAKEYLRSPNQNLLFAVAWGRLFKAEIIKKHNIRFNNALRTFEDVDFNFAFLKHAEHMYVSSAQTYLHFVNEQGQNATFYNKDFEKLYDFNHIISTVVGFFSNNVFYKVEGDLSQFCIRLLIIQTIRASVYLDQKIDKKRLVNILRSICQSKFFHTSNYTRQSGESLLLPILLKLKLYSLFVFACRLRGKKRYMK